MYFRSKRIPQLKPKKMGRPTLPRGQAKSGKIQVRMSADEQRMIEASAKAKKQTVSQWVRDALKTTLGRKA
jgi:predicted HicB family RNase H-like nuclease